MELRPRRNGRRSSFHETVIPALGLAEYHAVTGDADAVSAARRTAELLLEHRLFRSLRTGEPIHASWTKPHYPAYWHYDFLQGLRLLDAVGMLGDPQAKGAFDLLERARRPDGRFSGPAWWSARQPDAVDWGRGPDNEMLNLRAEKILERTVMRSKTISVSIERPPADVYAFVSDPRNLPRWASGLGTSIVESGYGWVVETPNGRLRIRFAPRNDFGILDHFVTTADGVEVSVPMRVIPNGDGSEVLFTLFQSPEMSDEEFAEDSGTVEKDLQTLKSVLET